MTLDSIVNRVKDTGSKAKSALKGAATYVAAPAALVAGMSGAQAGTIQMLQATDVYTANAPFQGAGLIGSDFYGGGQTGILKFDANNISPGPTDSFTVPYTIEDLAALPNGRIFYASTGTAYETEDTGAPVDDYFVGGQSGAEHLGAFQLGGKDYLSWVDDNFKEYGVYDLTTRQNQTLGTIGSLPGAATGLDTYVVPGGSSLNDVIYGVSSENGNIRFFQNGSQLANEANFIGFNGDMSDVAFGDINNGLFDVYAVSDIPAFGGPATGQAFRGDQPLAVVPAPGTAGLVALGLGMIAAGRRRGDYENRSD